MIFLKTEDEIELMRAANLLVADTLTEIAKNIRPGVTTKQLDALAEELIGDHIVIAVAHKVVPVFAFEVALAYLDFVTGNEDLLVSDLTDMAAPTACLVAELRLFPGAIATNTGKSFIHRPCPLFAPLDIVGKVTIFLPADAAEVFLHPHTVHQAGLAGSADHRHLEGGVGAPELVHANSGHF